MVFDEAFLTYKRNLSLKLLFKRFDQLLTQKMRILQNHQILFRNPKLKV